MRGEIWQHDQTKQNVLATRGSRPFEHDISLHLNKSQGTAVGELFLKYHLQQRPYFTSQNVCL